MRSNLAVFRTSKFGLRNSLAAIVATAETLRMQFGICNEIFEGWSLPDIFRFAKKAGYDAVEIAPFTLANYVTNIPETTRKQIREEAAQANISISGIHWVLVQAEGMYINHADAAVRQ